MGTSNCVLGASEQDMGRGFREQAAEAVGGGAAPDAVKMSTQGKVSNPETAEQDIHVSVRKRDGARTVRVGVDVPQVAAPGFHCPGGPECCSDSGVEATAMGADGYRVGGDLGKGEGKLGVSVGVLVPGHSGVPRAPAEVDATTRRGDLQEAGMDFTEKGVFPDSRSREYSTEGREAVGDDDRTVVSAEMRRTSRSAIARP